MELKIDKFNADKLAATRESWINTAESFGMLALEYERMLEMVATHMDYSRSKGDSFAYGIFEKDSDEAIAIVDIVYTSRSGSQVGWLKMLQVSLGPSLAEPQVASNPEKYGQVLDVYLTAIHGTISLTDDHKAKVVKLYGRNNELMTLFLALNERLRTTLDSPYHSKMEGRWLVISTH